MVENVLIVGGSSDIGLQVAKILIGLGVNVTLFARDESRLEEVKSMGAHAIIGDARKTEDFDNVIAHYEGKEIHGVVHCVGSIALRPPHAMKVEDFSEELSSLVSAFDIKTRDVSSSPPRRRQLRRRGEEKEKRRKKKPVSLFFFFFRRRR